jgi:glycosyltransferase involved in cell wall biosynthesis
MKKVIFYTQSRWAFAAIHRGLEKELYKYGIIANLLDWTQNYTPDEIRLLNDSYDLFVTNPEAIVHLNRLGIPPEKLATVAHGQWDMLLARRDFGNHFYKQIKKFGVVSNVLKTKAAEFGVERIPDVIPFGIHFDMFYRKPSEKLEKLGYGGAKETKNFFDVEIKRGHLVKQTASEIPQVSLVEHNFYNWMCMPGYYNSIDALAVSSIEESAGLPSMEAAAAGRLVLSTPVGYFEDYGPKGGGVVLPMGYPNETEYCSALKDSIQYYTKDSEAYNKKCLDIQEFARENYDWSKHIEKWVSFLY